jgi:hypothetical protein
LQVVPDRVKDVSKFPKDPLRWDLRVLRQLYLIAKKQIPSKEISELRDDLDEAYFERIKDPTE